MGEGFTKQVTFGLEFDSWRRVHQKLQREDIGGMENSMCKAQSLLSNPVWLLHTICAACGKWGWKCKLTAGIKVSIDTGKMTGCYLTNSVKYLKIFSSSLHHQILRKIFLVAVWVMNFRDEEESWQGKIERQNEKEANSEKWHVTEDENKGTDKIWSQLDLLVSCYGMWGREPYSGVLELFSLGKYTYRKNHFFL